MVDADISRREVLASLGAGVGGLTVGTGAAGATGTDRHIVGTSNQAATESAKQKAASVHRVLDFGDIGQAVAGQFSDKALENLDKNPNVRYIEEDGTMHAISQTLPWGIDRIDADLAHGNGFTGNGADIAIIDTGLDSDHPDLKKHIAYGECFADECCGQSGGCRFGIQPNSNDCNYAWDDDNDHGTHVGGTAGAPNNSEDVIGVSTEANLYAAKVLNGCGSGSYSNVAAGIKWVADQGFDVGNMSLGGSDSSTVEDACEYAYNTGVLLVAAAGNDGPCSDCVSYPAAYKEVIAVSATTKDNQLADFSSTGPEVELAAPGKDILSTVPPESSSDGTDTFSGTSMASPHVAGTGGLLMAEGQSNTKARTTLQDTAEDIGLSENEQGYGLVDAEAATNALGSDTSVAVSTDAASSVGSDNATLNGTLDDLGGASDADVYFEWRETGASSWNTTTKQTKSSTGSFSEDITGLSSGTEYEYRAVAEASDGDTDTGSKVTFTTDSSDTSVAVSTGDATSVGTDNATLNGKLDDLGGADSADVYFEYGESGTSLDQTSSTKTLSSTGSFSIDISGLSSGTDYDYRAVASAGDGDTDTGTTKTFTTDSSSSGSAPAIDKHKVTESGSPNPHANIDDDWAVSDSDGDLNTVTIKVFDSDGNKVDSATESVSGSSDSGFNEFKIQFGDGGTYDVTLTVTDSNNNSTSDTETVTA